MAMAAARRVRAVPYPALTRRGSDGRPAAAVGWHLQCSEAVWEQVHKLWAQEEVIAGLAAKVLHLTALVFAKYCHWASGLDCAFFLGPMGSEPAR